MSLLNTIEFIINHPLIRGNKLSSIIRFARWQVGSRLVPGAIVYDWISDTKNHALADGEQCDNVVTIGVTSLDDALNNECPSLIKIDVEGYETPVLEGAQKTLQNHALHSVIMELNGRGSRYGFDESKILALMLDHGFKTYSYDPLARELINLEGKNLNSENTLFIRDRSFVEERLRSSQKVSVNGRQF